MRRYLATPRRARRLAWGLIVVGAAAGGLATWLRGRFERGDAPFDWSYLLNVVGLFAILNGAVIEARVASLFLEFNVGPARRWAILETVAGIGLALIGCVALGAGPGGDATRVARVVLLGRG